MFTVQDISRRANTTEVVDLTGVTHNVFGLDYVMRETDGSYATTISMETVDWDAFQQSITNLLAKFDREGRAITYQDDTACYTETHGFILRGYYDPAREDGIRLAKERLEALRQARLVAEGYKGLAS